MKRFQYSIISFCVILLMNSCSSDDDPLTIEDVSENIEMDIRPFVETFAEEAELRGQFFDFDGFEATFSVEEIGDNGDICGRASPLDGDENFIIIRLNDNCWLDQSEATREALIFHELGHALLNRPHRDDRFDNGLVKSLMVTGMLGPYNAFTPILRTYLVDELFDLNTPDPEWALGRTKELEIELNSGLEESVSGWQFVTTENILLASSSGARTDEAAATGDFSLRLVNEQPSEGTAFWRNRILNISGIPETAEIVIEVKVRMQSVQGAGVAIVGALDKGGEILDFVSSENDLVLTGTSDFQIHQIIIPYFPNAAASITILLALLPNTSGLVYFDDIKATARYNPAFGP